ncbi:CHAT domain-containing protein [Amylostereum chailletii]|nr:CHAT domain-containing protein [Amylostereum chailletii]
MANIGKSPEDPDPEVIHTSGHYPRTESDDSVSREGARPSLHDVAEQEHQPELPLEPTCKQVSHFLTSLAQYLTRFNREAAEYTQPEPDQTINRAKLALQSACADRCTLLQTVAQMLQQRHEHQGRPADLEDSIHHYRQSLLLAGDAGRAPLQHHLSTALRISFEQSSDTEQLDEAILLARASKDSMSFDNKLYVVVLVNLAHCLFLRDQTRVVKSDALYSEEVGALHRQALQICHDGHPHFVTALRSQVEQHIVAFALELPALFPNSPFFSKIVDKTLLDTWEQQLSDWVHQLKEATQSTSIKDPEYPRVLHTMGHCLYMRARVTRNANDLMESIRFFSRALVLLPPGHIERPFVLTRFSYAMASDLRKELCNLPACIHGDLLFLESESRVALARLAVEQSPSKHHLSPTILVSLAASLEQKLTSVLDYNELTVGNSWRTFVHVLPTDERVLPVSEEIIEVWRSACSLHCVPGPDGTLAVSPRLHEFIHTPAVEYNYPIELEDEITSLFRHCVPLDSGTQTFCLFLGLAHALHENYHVWNRYDDLVECMRLNIKGYRMVFGEDLSWVNGLNSHFPAASRDRLTHFLTVEDKLKSTDLARDSSESIGGYYDYRERRWIVSSRTIEVIMQRLYNTNNREALAKVVGIFDDWIPLLSGTAGHSELMIQHARALLYRFHLQKQNVDLEKCAQIVDTLFKDGTHPEANRLRAVAWWGTEAAAMGLTNSASEAFDRAISLQSRIAFIRMDIKTRMGVLKHTPNLPCDAASFELARGYPQHAVEYLEQGRGVLWAQIHAFRVPLQTLPEGIAARFQEITNALRADQPIYDHDRRRLRLGEEFDILMERIRVLQPEMHTYLPCPRTFNTIKAAAKGGPVVFLFAGYRAETCHAIIIRDHTVETPDHLALSSTNIHSLREMGQSLAAANRGSRDAEDSLRQGPASGHSLERLKTLRISQQRAQDHRRLLSEIWRLIVQPIIKHLGLKKIAPDDAGSRPRLWWCPAGDFAFLPVHAAGVYNSEGDTDCAMDYFVSSYTPTLSSLLIARATVVAQATPPKTLIIAQQETPHHVSLPSVAQEVRAVKSLLPPGSILDFEGREPSETGEDISVDWVKQRLPEATILHLACHGSQHPVFPDNSSFHLRDGDLRINDLMQIEMSKAQFAFLSACDSAAGDKNRPDESIHLAAAMLAVGFKSVIGTMWSMHDADGPDVAAEVYSKIFKDGELDLAAVPHALDSAVYKLRRKGVPISRWATYVHMGL